MKKNLTELVFILDKSGSMAGLEADTIGGYNALLAKQKKAEGEAIVTTILFNHEIDLLHDRINLGGIAPISESDYEVGSTTALLDAIGFGIQKISKAQKHTIEKERATKVLFVITTDGMENASHEYNYSKVRTLIEKHKKIGWEFMFLGANIDAIATAEKFGIEEDRAVTYHADSVGTQKNFEAVHEAVANFRGNRRMDGWKQHIEEDFKERK